LAEYDGLAKLRRQYGCGPVEFTGAEHALYERHLMFDDVVNPVTAGPWDRFEAFARSVRPPATNAVRRPGRVDAESDSERGGIR
jgi:hypothetical protein